LAGKKKIAIEMSYSGAVALAADSNYGYNTAMYELIDNSFASGANNVTVTITTDSDNKVLAVKIEDDGEGLAIDDIGKALAPGAKKGNGINEHGVGMKAAIDHFGKLDEMHSCTGSEEWYIYELNPDENDLSVEIDEVPVVSQPGMLLTIECGQEGKAVYHINHASSRPKIDSYKWGYRYADILSKPNKTLTMVIEDESGKVEKKKIEVEPWMVEHESEFVNKVPLKGVVHDWEATLTISKLQETHNQYDPVKASTGAGGIDIVMHGRCVVSRSKAPLKGILKANGDPLDFTHPSYNRLYGRLIVERGIKTTPKKDNIQENDPAFVELVGLLAQVWEDRDLSSHFKKEDVPDVTEAHIEANLMKLLDEDGFTKIEHQQKTKYGFRTDVQAEKGGERFVWEVKKDKAVCNDLLQLVNYMQIGGFTKGHLVADGFHGDVQEYAEKCWPDYEIEFWDLSSVKYGGMKK